MLCSFFLFRSNRTSYIVCFGGFRCLYGLDIGATFRFFLFRYFNNNNKGDGGGVGGFDILAVFQI